MKKKVLFVDDEINVLQGLKRMLHPLRQEWEMAFVQSSAEALDYLAREPFDVIVTDIRMPGTDGAQLLQRVSQLYPNMVRIILSGQANEEMIYRTIGPSHQYLSKPCEPDVLRKTIERAFAIRKMLNNEKLKEVISNIDRLPSLPKLYSELIQVLKDPDVSVQDVGNIISRDVSMTAKILKLVNSAYFGLRRNVADPVEAVKFIGLDAIKSMVLSMKFFSSFDPRKLQKFSLENVFNHSTTVGLLCKCIAEQEGNNRAWQSEAFLAGMLHDAGKLIFADNFYDSYQQVFTLARERDLPLWEAEKEVFGVTHGEVGAYLLGLWGASDIIIEAIAYHHRPLECVHKEMGLLTLVHVANGLANRASGVEKTGQQSYFQDEYLEQIGVKDKIQEWETRCQKSMENKEDYE